MIRKFLFIILCASTVITNAQTDSATSTKVQFKVSGNYNSGLNYYGRTDSLRSSGYFPMAELWFGESFYINAAPIFVNNKAVSFDYAGSVATVGYQFNGSKWLGNIYFLKPFYEANSGLVQSALKAQSGVSITKLNQVLNVTAGADAKFSDKVDFGAMGGIDHIFRVQNTDNSVFVADPSFYVYAGTQQFQETYYKRSNNPILPPTEETKNINRFNILAYELSMPVIYAKNKIMLIATPAYVMPQNLIEVPNRPDLSERGKGMFYTTVAVKYTF
jgi:hypothetical protein